MSQINNSFGSGGMSLALNEAQFSQFLQYLKDDVSSLPIRAAGVMGPDIQLDENGEMMTEEQKSIVWHQAFLVERLGNIHLHEVIPKLRTPLDASVLTRYVYTVELCE